MHAGKQKTFPLMKTVCYQDCWDHSPTAYSDMTTKPPTHSLSAAHPECPKSPSHSLI